MGGEIRLESEPSKGSRFEFEITFELSDMTGAESVPFNAELAGLRVIIIDDNQTNCDLYRQMCTGWGYRSSIAKDGVSGLEMMEEAVREGDPFKLILLDQQMPGLTGLDLASLVRSRPDLRETRILLLSSSLNREESQRADEIGISRALAKPVKRVTLQEVILETFGVGRDGPRSWGTKLLSRKTEPMRSPRCASMALIVSLWTLKCPIWTALRPPAGFARMRMLMEARATISSRSQPMP